MKQTWIRLHKVLCNRRPQELGLSVKQPALSCTSEKNRAGRVVGHEAGRQGRAEKGRAGQGRAEKGRAGQGRAGR